MYLERWSDNKIHTHTHTHTHLCKQFLGATTGLNIHKGIMSILDHAMTKGTHAKLNQ